VFDRRIAGDWWWGRIGVVGLDGLVVFNCGWRGLRGFYRCVVGNGVFIEFIMGSYCLKNEDSLEAFSTFLSKLL